MAFTLLDTVRQPVSQLLALNEDGTTLLDVSSFLQSADLQFTDELISHQATFVVQNTQGYFDKYGTAAGAGVLVENRLLQYKKGFADLTTGAVTLYPAFVGRITSALPPYNRSRAETITLTCFDLLKLSLKHKFTSDPYYNTQINLIASDLVTRYGDKAATLFGTNLAALSYPMEYVDFPDMTLIDCLQDLFDVPTYAVWFNYAGQLASRPKLGSAASGAPALLGYPDATGPPSSVDFTFPDATLIEEIEEEWQDHEFTNQVKVLGRALAESITLGPDQVLTTLGDPVNTNFLSPGGGLTKRLFFSDQSGNNNQISASNVYLKIYDPSFNNDNGTSYKYIATGPGITNDLGQIIPYPVQESSWPSNQQSVVSRKSDGRQEGAICLKLLAGTVTAPPSLTFTDLFAFANADGGGYLFAVEVHGRPVLTDQQTLTAIVDYNPQSLTETLTDVFGDHQTYQGSKAPWAGGTPVEVAVNPSALPSTTLTAAATAGASTLTVASVTGLLPPATPLITSANVLAIGSGAAREYALVQSIAGSIVTLAAPLANGHSSGDPVNGLTAVISADDLYRSLLVKGDWERGRLVFTDLTYRPFTADPGIGGGTPGATETGGSAYSNTIAFSTQFVTDPAPLAVYQTGRYCNFGNAITYALTGLQVGRGYTLRLHFADPSSTGAGQRVFAIYVNGAVSQQSFDIYSQAQGKQRATVLEITGVNPDATGTVTLAFQNGGVDGGVWDPMINGIEVVLPQGTGGEAYAINCGGAALTPTPPIVQTAYGWSAVQQVYGLQSQTIDDALVRTLSECRARALYEVNKAAWGRNPIKLTTASIPTIEPGQKIKWFNPRQGNFGADQWGYVQAIERRTERTASGGTDADTYATYLLYRLLRTS